MKLAVFTKKVKIKQKAGEDTSRVTERRKENTGAIIIKTKGTTYADLLKEVRAEVKTQQVKANIRSIREARNGDIVIAMNRGSDTKILKETVSSKVGKERIRIRGNQKMRFLHIKGMDSLTSKEETVEAAKESLSGQTRDADQITVTNMRPSYDPVGYGTRDGSNSQQTVRNSITHHRYHEMPDKGEIKRCYRCWGYNHQSTDCDSQDRTQNCKDCGGPGHLAEECRKAMWCPLCNEKGHRAGSFRCAKHKAALAKSRAPGKTPRD